MLEEVNFGKIGVCGDIRRGMLSEITNRELDLKFDFTESTSMFMLEVEEGNDTLNYYLNELDVCNENGIKWLCNSKRTFSVCLDWNPTEEGDALICKFRFVTDESSLTLRRIHFTLPGKIVFPENAGTDVLMFPKATGMKIADPAKEFFTPMDMKYADWKDRQLFVWKDGFHQPEVIPEHYVYESDASMGWMDYYCEQGGVYLGAHDAAFDQVEAKVSVDRGEDGVGLGLVKTINRHISDYKTEFAIGIHSGDWHRGAEIYRNFFDCNGFKVRRLPTFMKKSPGVMCHYDFKWQDRTVNHRFEDIDSIYDEAKEFGYNQILVAGWNRDGFDNSYPDFTPAVELGTEEELIESVAKVNAKGGGVFFYINAHSYDRASEDFDEYGSKWAVKKRDGDYSHEVYATSKLIRMCNSADGWREKIKHNIKYLIKEIGAKGVYIDQLNVIPKVCYDESHDHDRSWKQNNVRILSELRKELGPEYEDKIFLFCEWANDGVLGEIDSLLFQACWYYSLKYSASEMFRYTFPEMAGLEMIMQKPWAATPETLEQTYVHDQFCKMYITGHIFWTYDHVPYTPGFKDFFKEAIQMRGRVADLFADGKFIDDVIIDSSSDGVDAKAFEMPYGCCFLCVWNKTGHVGEIHFKSAKNVGSLEVLTLNGDKETFINDDIKNIECPASELSIIVLNKE